MKKSIVFLMAMLVCLPVLSAYGTVVVYKVSADATVLAADVNGAEPNSIQDLNLKGLLVADVNIIDANQVLVSSSTIIWFGRTGCEPNNFFVSELGTIKELDNFVVDSGKKAFHEIVLEISGIAGDNEVILLGKVAKCRKVNGTIARQVPGEFEGCWSLDEAILSFLPSGLADDVLHGSGNIALTFDAKQTTDANGLAFDEAVTGIENNLTTKLQQMNCRKHHERWDYDNDDQPGKNDNNNRDRW